MKMEFGEKKKKRNYNQMLELNKNHLNVDAKNIIEPKIKNLTLPKLNRHWHLRVPRLRQEKRRTGPRHSGRVQ